MAEDMSEIPRDVLVARLWKAENRADELFQALADRAERIEELESKLEELKRGNVQADENHSKAN